MSVRSMTGFGAGSSRREGLRVEAEISSVNRRQLDLQMNLPRALAVLEPRIQEELARVLTRGRVTLNVRVREGMRGPPRVRVDMGLARATVDAVRAAAKTLKLPDGLDSGLLLAVPDLVQVRHLTDDIERVWPALREAIERALASLDRMRSREGRALRADILKRLALLERRVGDIRARAPESVRRRQEQLHARIAEAGLQAGDHADRIAREVALFADRSDVSEEMTRIQSHLDQARALLHSKEPSGRALDFLCQELLREINTTGSKSGDATITAKVVEFKAELERIREQVQNIE
ncbi:MAG: YicC family protein [Kiritimatiellae bacterium]|nr:YicC family protein [Kiritimatiellia bacterium]